MVSSIGDPERHTLPVRVKLANPDFRLRPNVYARVRFIVQHQDATLEIPATALVSDGEKQYVYVQDSARPLLASRHRRRIGARRAAAGAVRAQRMARRSSSRAPFSSTTRSRSSPSSQIADRSPCSTRCSTTRSGTRSRRSSWPRSSPAGATTRSRTSRSRRSPIRPTRRCRSSRSSPGSRPRRSSGASRCRSSARSTARRACSGCAASRCSGCRSSRSPSTTASTRCCARQQVLGAHRRRRSCPKACSRRSVRWRRRSARSIATRWTARTPIR